MILVTGGAGFIGSHVCEALLKKGKKVVCIDNFNNYYDPKIKLKNIADFPSKNFTLCKADITNYAALEKIFKKERISQIIHLAARAGVRPSIENPKIYQKVNVEGTLNILELARKYKITNIIFGSSSSVYGSRTNIPFSEEDTTDFPVSPYAATKKAGEVLCYSYHYLYNLPITCLRFFTVYGPRGRPDMAVYKFTKLIDQGKPIEVYGESKRDYTFIKDIVQGILSALDNPHDFEIINLGNSHPVELSTLIATIEKHLGKKATLIQKGVQPGDVPLTFADVRKAKKLLNYSPNTSIDQGIKEFIRWYHES